MMAIVDSCPLLSHLDLSGCTWVTNEIVEVILAKSKKLQCLNLFGCSSLSQDLVKMFYFDSTDELKSCILGILHPPSATANR